MNGGKLVQTYRLIVLDDDLAQGEMIKAYLELVSQYQVDITTHTEAFWEQINRTPYDLVLLDYKLEETNGLEVLSQMKQRGVRLPVIMITGEGDERVAVRAIQEGASDYLVKGSDYLPSLPGLIQRAVRMFELQALAERSMEEARYQALMLDNIRDAVVVWDLEGKITYWNFAAEKLFGWKAVERLGESAEECYFNLFDPPIRMPGPEDTAGLEVERACVNRHGRHLWISSRVMPLRQYSPEARLLGFMDVSRDVTRRRQEREMLRQSQHFITRILETSPSMLYLYDLSEDRLVYVNHRIKDVLGVPAGSWLGKEGDLLFRAIHPEDAPLLQQFRQTLKQARDGEVLEAEFRIRDGGGGWRWVYTRETIFQRSAEGEPVQILGAAQDISVRRRIEEDLKRRIKNERLLAEISSRFIHLDQIHLESEISASLRLLGDTIGASRVYLYLLPPGEEALHLYVFWESAEVFRRFSHGLNKQVVLEDIPELWGMLQSGRSVRWIEQDEQGAVALWQEYQSLQPERVGAFLLLPLLHNQRIYGVLGCESLSDRLSSHEGDLSLVQEVGRILTNVIVQADFNRALRESEARYRAIVEDHQTELICRFDPHGNLTFVNETFCRYFGREREALLGVSILELVYPSDRMDVEEGIAKLTPSAPVSTYEARLFGGDEQEIWIEWTSRAIFEQGGDCLIEIQSIGRDITERKRLEAQVEATRVQLAEANRLASIGLLAASVAHLINNPLTAIIAEAQLLLHQSGHQARIRESAEAIEKAGWRAQQVVQKLLGFSSRASEPHTLVDVNQTVRQALELLSDPLNEASLHLELSLQEPLPGVWGNAGQLVDLWLNLLWLALDGIALTRPTHPRIVLRTRSLGGQVVVEIMDNGKVIPPEAMKVIFEPQVVSPSEGRGTGIEFTLCRELARQNQGVIEVESQPDQTCFRVLFPGINHN